MNGKFDSIYMCVCTKLCRVSSCFRFHLHWDWNLLENNRLNQSHILMPGLVLYACYSGPHSNSQHLRKRSGIRVCRALYPRSPTGSLETERCPCMKTVCDVIFQISLGKYWISLVLYRLSNVSITYFDIVKSKASPSF